MNDILRVFHEDVATLRREMIATGLLVRYCGEYARLEQPHVAPHRQVRGPARTL